MGAICVHEFMSLDGVIDAPTLDLRVRVGSEDGRGPRCGHRPLPRHPPRGAQYLRDVRGALVEPHVEDDPGTPFFNDTTKYVVSSTLTDPTWRNSEVIGPYDADLIRRLKNEVDGDL